MNYLHRMSIAAMMLSLVGPAALGYGAESEGIKKETAAKPSAENSGSETSSAASAEKGDGEKAKSPPKIEGIELGKFSVRAHRAVPAQMNRISFTLYARVSAEEAKHFEQQLEHRENKVREQVIVATRLVPVEEFDDAEFTKFRRRILLRLRRSLPELTIDDVYVSDFELVVENT
jgi:hypothetical protein